MFRALIGILLVQATLFVFGDDTYNCHGFAWQAEPTWLETPPIQSAKEVDSGPIIVYFRGEQPIHSGKHISHGWILSKWGENPLILHPAWLSVYGWDWKYYEKH